MPSGVPVLHEALLALIVCAAAFAAAHAIVNKREPRSAAMWLLAILLLPAAGPVLYAFFGVNRFRRRALRRRRAMKRYHAAGAPEPRLPPAQLVPLARLVGEVVERPLVPGNSVEPLFDGHEAYPAMLEAIDGARRSIALASYIFHGTGIGERFVQALIGAMKRGVEVRVLVDDVSYRFSHSSAAKKLSDAGVPVDVFNPPLVPARLHALQLRNHRKILVVDGETGFTGGINIDRRHWGAKCSHDLHFRLRGPVVTQLMEVFADDWKFTAGEALHGPAWFPPIAEHRAEQGDTLARGIETGPDENFERLRWAYVGGLAAARRSVRICTPYFLPDSGLVSHLNAAAMRGVEVDILLPARSDLPHVHWATFHQLWQVLEHGCRVWLKPGRFDHSKLMVVDAEWTLIGSGNWDARSLRLNFEFDVECYSKSLGARMELYALKRRAASRRVTLESVNRRPLPVKLRDGAARLFAPLL